jgi:hypothetical protein
MRVSVQPSLAQPLLWLEAVGLGESSMSRLIEFYSVSLAGLRGALPVLGALIAIRPEHTSIAASIPGLGQCKSTFCKPERRELAQRS